MNRPKMDGPATTALPPSRTDPPIPTEVRMRTMRPRMTGALTTSARKMVRRDQSIWPRLRSNTRNAAVTNDGGRVARAGTGGAAGIDSTATSLHQVLENGLQVVIRRGHFGNLARFARRGQLRQPRVEPVRGGCLHHHRPLLEPQANHIVVRQEPPRQAARVGGANVDGVRVRVDQVADLVDVALGQDPPVVDQQDVRGHRLDLVQDAVSYTHLRA